MNGIETLEVDGNVLGFVIRSDATPESTGFITGDDADPPGRVRRLSRAAARCSRTSTCRSSGSVVGTAEFIVVRSGRCYVDVYSDERADRRDARARSRRRDPVARGGHGFRMIEDTVLLELKQGPFLPGLDKERFERPEDATPA